MCVIIIKQSAATKLSLEVAKTSARINPHGLGIVWLDTYEVTYHKSSEYKKLDTTRPFIAHFRYATVGAIGKDNTHPFTCGNNRNELLMMNGTINGLGNDKVSDSKALAINLGEIPRHKWKSELEQYECRFITVNVRNRTFQIYNKELWTQRDGIWFSKSNVLEDHIVAVYGTLKKGYSNYWRHLQSSKYIGSGKTEDRYPLVVEGLPYLINERGIGHNVNVDVFKVSDSVLERLDILEGHPKWYRREQIRIRLNGKIVWCWIYFNLQASSHGKKLHQTYEQSYAKSMMFSSQKIVETTVYEDEDDTQTMMDSDHPICIDCFHDLEHDGFSNYYCSGCNGWFTEAEVEEYMA